jgi:hypothetical protein
MCEPDFSSKARTTTAEAVRQVYEIFWAGLFQGRRERKPAQRKPPLRIEDEIDLAIG